MISKAQIKADKRAIAHAKMILRLQRLAPWKATRLDKAACDCFVNYGGNRDSEPIVYCVTHAAAPALLEALRLLEPHLDGDSEGPSNGEIEQVRAAIRAAKGEAQS